MFSETVENQLANFTLITKRAQEFVDKASDEGARNCERNYNLGIAAYIMQEYSTALEHFIISFDENPDDEKSARIALCYWRNLNVSDAREWINKAIQKNKDGSIKAACLGHESSYKSIAAEIELSDGHIEQAKEIASDVLSKNKSDVLAAVVMANASAATGNFTKASEYTNLAILHAPDYTKRRLEKATSIFHEMTDLDSDGVPFIKELSAFTSRVAV